MPVGQYMRKPRGAYRPRPIIIPVGPSIAYVELTRGQYSLIDYEDVPVLTGYNWHAQWSGRMRNFYAGRNLGGTVVRLHRVLMNNPLDKDVDHINGNTLDNRRSCNLRAVTTAQNIQNQRVRRNNTSGCKGVTWNKRSMKWTVAIRANNVSIWLGTFVDYEAAVKVRRDAEVRLFGEFLRVH